MAVCAKRLAVSGVVARIVPTMTIAPQTDRSRQGRRSGSQPSTPAVAYAAANRAVRALLRPAASSPLAKKYFAAGPSCPAMSPTLSNDSAVPKNVEAALMRQPPVRHQCRNPHHDDSVEEEQ